MKGRPAVVDLAPEVVRVLEKLGELTGQHDAALAELRIEVAMARSRVRALESSSERLARIAFELGDRVSQLEQRLPAREPACEAPTPADCLAEQLGRHEAG